MWLPNEVRVREAVRRDEEQRLLLASERRAELEVARLIVGVVGAVKLRLCALPLVSSSGFCQVPCLSCLLLFGLAVGLVVRACLQCPACSPQARGGEMAASLTRDGDGKNSRRLRCKRWSGQSR